VRYRSGAVAPTDGGGKRPGSMVIPQFEYRLPTRAGCAAQ
jgi:hypothetical protein